MGLTENNLPVHVKHFKDGYPLCWDQDQEGTFEASFDEGQVTCVDCIEYLRED